MRLGGTARYVIDVYSLADVKEAYDFANTHPNSTNNHSNPANNPSISASSPLNPANQPALTPKMPLPTFPLGSGSNTIGRDDGFPGVIIINHLKGMEIIEETSDDVLVRAAGGEVWDDFVEFCTEKGYSGIEAMSGIPGTVGAAPVQDYR